MPRGGRALGPPAQGSAGYGSAIWGQGAPPMAGGGGGGPMGGSGTGGVPNPPSFEANIEADPNLQWQVDAYKTQMGESPLQKQKQLIGQDVMESASAQGRAIDNMMARRGISDSGIQVQKQAENQDSAQRQKNRLYAEADLNDTKRKDALLMGGQNIMQAPAQLQVQQARDSFNNWMGVNNQAMQRQDTTFNQMMAMFGMFKPQGGYAGSMPSMGGGGGGGAAGPRVLGPGGSVPGVPDGQSPFGSVYNDPWFKGFLRGGSGGGGGNRMGAAGGFRGGRI